MTYNITGMRGEIVNDFTNIEDREKWQYVKGFGSAVGGIWLMFTEEFLIQGYSILHGWYYAHIDVTKRTMYGVLFDESKGPLPIGEFELTPQ